MESLKNVISSFELKKELNPKMWVKGGEKINPSVRRNLLEIAYQFIDSFGLDVVVDDIVVTGSIANYNWSKYSDVDLHILIDYKQFKQEMKDLYVEFFDLKKIVFNEKRQLTMFGYDVEVYVEDNDKQGISGGVYSIMRDEWIIKPKKDSFGKANMKEVKEKAEQWMRIINEVLKNIGNESPEEIRKIIKKYKDKLKKYRVSGLEKGGEMSIENLVFKTLRRNGYIEKLYNIPTKLIDKKLSLKEAAETIPGGFSVDLDMGPTYHSSRKLGNWESDNAWDMFAPVGTEVYSYTKGKVSNKKDYGSNSGKIYGIGVVIKGTDGYPDIFYTHIKNVDIEIGDTVDVGDYIGEIAEWPGNPGGEHVHIGLPYGEKLEDYISGVNPNLESKRHNDSLEDLDSDEFDEIKNNIFEKKPELEKNDDSEILKDSKDSRFMKDFLNMSNNNIDISEEDEVISYNSQVEKIQIALQFLDYLDLNYGIDGFYDEKTINAMNKFRDDFDLPKSTNIKKEDLLYMYFVLLYNLFDNSKLYKINKIPNYDELELTTINNFYQMVLIWLNADITYNNINFLNAWNDATIIGGEQNPFGLPFPKEKTTFSPILNTLDVLNLPEYSCVKAGLLQNKKSKEILNCRVFDKDNLREKIKNFLHK